MSSRQHSPKASKPFAKSPTLWLAGVSRSLEEPKNRRAVFSILALLTGLVALTALFETENQLFPVQRSLIPINADQIYGATIAHSHQRGPNLQKSVERSVELGHFERVVEIIGRKQQHIYNETIKTESYHRREAR